MRNRLLLRAALAACAIATLGGCASFQVSERAWANGQAMSNSIAYDRAMMGDMSLQTVSQLKAAANPRRLNQRDVAYPPFSHWRW